ncbi:SRPBCC family protein [Aureibaculum sp. 2210JD6-5]|uniref:SRPBCC family protein n=1 Tax=Aureibaculum sp. 2210JD6-5 TaxID=3103957 RepID=UPI002AAD36EF|nr:SRPBCC family protein [Aureibaculum sp. 2210JD6-5]MDY7396926.1 SRPBCC family protein [Aureibaculum sp. 2210JD6-5]
MNLETDKVIVKKSQEEMFEFLTKVENYEQIMPENTDKFEVGEDSFLFALKGMPEIRLKLREKIANNKVVLGSTSDKFPFTLTGNIEKHTPNPSQEGNFCEVQLVFDGKFNPMMAMMIKNPIQKFISTLTENIAKL